MERQIKTIYKKAEASFNNPEHKKKWQGGIGILVMVVFVLSSVLFNNTVQALNQAAGNYGYRSGSYGYSASTTSSNIPSAPTSLGSSVTTTTGTLTWTSPTTVVGGGASSYDNPHATTPYLIHYSTSSLSSCSGGSTATSTSASVTLSSLSSATVYYVAICAYDTNLNTSAALTGSFTTSSSGGGGGGGGNAQSVSAAPPTAPVTVVVPVAPAPAPAPAVTARPMVSNAANLISELGKLGINVKRDEKAEKAQATKVTSSASQFKVKLDAEAKLVATNFVVYGISSATVKLGSGERLALLRDQLETLGKVSTTALEQIANGKKPTERNLKKEQAQVKAALAAFQKLTGKKAPNFKDAKDDLAWNTLMYRIRFTRDLAKEKAGIVKFKAKFKRNPKTPLEWSAVRAWGYVLK